MNDPIDSVNFGIDILPLGTAHTNAAVINPGDTNTVVIPFTSFTGTDADGGTVNSTPGFNPIAGITITGLPAAATSNINRLVVNGVSYTTANFPVAGITIYPSDVLAIDPVNNPDVANAYGAPSTTINAIFPYKVIDSAGKTAAVAVNLTQPLTDLYVRGKVYLDPNGGTVDGTYPLSTIGANNMFVSLVDSTTGLVVATKAIANASYPGAFVFGTSAGISANKGYNVVVSNRIGTVGQIPPVTTLTNAVNTGESTTGTGNLGDLDSNGVLVIHTGVAPPATDLAFGIDILPVPVGGSLPLQSNPGGGAMVQIAASYFSNTQGDAPYGGTVTKYRITSFPGFVDSFTVHYATGDTTYNPFTFPVTGVYLPPNIGIGIDPQNGDFSVTPISIPYTAIDNAGHESFSAALIDVPLNDLALSGTIFDDNNGTNDAKVNGTGKDTMGVNTLSVNLVNSTTGLVVATRLANNNGTYLFGTADGVKPGTAYKVEVSDTAGVIGNLPPSTLLIHAKHTAEALINAADGTADGIYSVTTGAASSATAGTANINFGIDQLPYTIQPATLASQVNPGGTTFVNVPLTNFAGTDPEDGTHVPYLHFTRFPDSVTTLRITVNTGQYAYTKATFPIGGVYAPLIYGTNVTSVDIDPVNGAVTAAIPFKVLDSATTATVYPGYTPATSFESTDSATVLVPFTDFTLSGTVFDDRNGMANNKVDGTGTNVIGPDSIYVNLQSAGIVIASHKAASNGTYTFTTADGLKTATAIGANIYTGFSVSISKGAPALNTYLPVQTYTTAVTTGESLNPTGSDGQPSDGIIQVTTGTANITGVNFGLDNLPVDSNLTAASQLNPGGTTQVTVPAALFASSDPEEGVADSVRFTTFPTNITSIFINGTGYTAAATAGFTTFPAAGVIVPRTGLSVTIDPVNMASTFSAVIPYKVRDTAGKESTVAGSVTKPFYDLTVSGRVYDDYNGITDSLVKRNAKLCYGRRRTEFTRT